MLALPCVSIQRVHDNENECILKKQKVEVHNVDPLYIGNFVGFLHEFDDDTKLNVIQNHWRHLFTFDFPYREFGSNGNNVKKPNRRRFSPPVV